MIPYDMKAIELTYHSLLADCARLSGFSEIRGSVIDLHWLLNEAPQLEKHVLDCIEFARKLDLDRFPVQLRRLATASLCDAYKLRFLRQLLLFCYKAYVTHDEVTCSKAFTSFIDTNRQVGEGAKGICKIPSRLIDLARQHCQSVLYRFRPKGIKPGHGPGASTSPKDKWSHWYETIEPVYPYSDWFYFYYNRSHLAELDDSVRREYIEAKLIAVPKDSRGPRLICVHPAEAIWLQQGLRRELERCISLERSAKGPWPRGYVHFDDQVINGRIALLSSRSRRYATIDLKEASDRLSDSLIQLLFGSKYKYFGCCRAHKYFIPSLYEIRDEVTPNYDALPDEVRGKHYWLNSYAPMGNATTFPVQSLVFWAICVASMQYRGFHQPGAAFVFGDDILVPTAIAPSVMEDLETFGLRVNRLKTFVHGHFRESCGVDAFNGINVTPVRWKCGLDAEGLTGLQSLSELAMRLRIAGYEEAASAAYAKLRHRMQSFPRRFRKLALTNCRNHAGLAEYVDRESEVWHDAKWHRSYQRFMIPVTRLEYHSPRRVIPGWNQALESVLSIERTGKGRVPDRNVSRRLRLIRGWTEVS